MPKHGAQICAWAATRGYVQTWYRTPSLNGSPSVKVIDRVDKRHAGVREAYFNTLIFCAN